MIRIGFNLGFKARKNRAWGSRVCCSGFRLWAWVLGFARLAWELQKIGNQTPLNPEPETLNPL